MEGGRREGVKRTGARSRTSSPFFPFLPRRLRARSKKGTGFLKALIPASSVPGTTFREIVGESGKSGVGP